MDGAFLMTGKRPGKERWSGLSESNRHLNLGKVPYYHYTKAASVLLFSFYNTRRRFATSSRLSGFPNLGAAFYETWLIRAAFTTGDLRWRSAKREALSLSVYTRPKDRKSTRLNSSHGSLS